MGATNPKEAEAGTIRADFADSIDANAVHGSDSLENAEIEIAFFFQKRDSLKRLRVKIPFSKVTSTPKSFKYTKNFLTLECKLKKIDRDSVSLEGKIFGKISLECDRCAVDFLEKVDWSLKLTLYKTVVKDLKDLDIIEFINSDIDFETILDHVKLIHINYYITIVKM